MIPFLLLAPVLIGLSVWLGLRGKTDPGVAQTHADFARITAALEAWRAEHGSIPEEGDLSFLVPKYLPEVPVNPWGYPYAYASNGQRPFLQSYGADGVRGGNGPNEDHTSHDGHSAFLPRSP
jgi:general secretion pathway protein G